VSEAGCQAGSITRTRIRGEVYVLTKEEGGRTRRSSRVIAAVLLSHHRCDGMIELPATPRCDAGDNIKMTVDLIARSRWRMAALAIREGGRTVGAGVVSRF